MHNHEQKIVVFIDQQKFTLENREYTPREMLELAGENPSETQLVLQRGREIHKFEAPDTPIRVENGMHFVVFHCTPTTVS